MLSVFNGLALVGTSTAIYLLSSFSTCPPMHASAESLFRVDFILHACASCAASTLNRINFNHVDRACEPSRNERATCEPLVDTPRYDTRRGEEATSEERS